MGLHEGVSLVYVDRATRQARQADTFTSTVRGDSGLVKVDHDAGNAVTCVGLVKADPSSSSPLHSALGQH